MAKCDVMRLGLIAIFDFDSDFGSYLSGVLYCSALLSIKGVFPTYSVLPFILSYSPVFQLGGST
jgi:hypothetical protein